jgi:GTPase
VADVLRRLGTRVVVVANKADNAEREQAAAEAYELGFGDAHAVSALHGRAIGDVLDTLVEGFADIEPAEGMEAAIAIVGRPNVGK